jgi:hypothetical protein
VAGFGLFGLVLETLHAFKTSAYLDVSNEPRRLMWTLAHAHGTLMGLIHIGFAATLGFWNVRAPQARQISTALIAATVLLPGGFLLGGIRFYGGDPGLGVALVPVGAGLLVYAAIVAARSTTGVQ